MMLYEIQEISVSLPLAIFPSSTFFFSHNRRQLICPDSFLFHSRISQDTSTLTFSSMSLPEVEKWRIDTDKKEAILDQREGEIFGRTQGLYKHDSMATPLMVALCYIAGCVCAVWINDTVWSMLFPRLSGKKCTLKLLESSQVAGTPHRFIRSRRCSVVPCVGCQQLPVSTSWLGMLWGATVRHKCKILYVVHADKRGVVNMNLIPWLLWQVQK